MSVKWKIIILAWVFGISAVFLVLNGMQYANTGMTVVGILFAFISLIFWVTEGEI